MGEEALKDWRGTSIEKGSRVVWIGGYDGKTMKEGTVVDFEEIWTEHTYPRSLDPERVYRYNRSWIKVRHTQSYISSEGEAKTYSYVTKPNWDRVTVVAPAP